MMGSRALLAGLVIGLGCLSSCQENLPALVQGATTVGGIGYDCKQAKDPASIANLSQSPEMRKRLGEDFPAGSPASQLESALKQQAFTLQGPCSPDQSVRWAQFRRNGNEVVANIYWRVDGNGKLLWTLGSVFYTSI